MIFSLKSCFRNNERQRLRDFTLPTYRNLVQELLNTGYSIQTLQDYIQQPKDKTVILRHDVDRNPKNSLKIAKIENATGINSSYYFRIVKKSYDENIIRQIAEMGHEIGYHYEEMNLTKGDHKKAIQLFNDNLKRIRKIKIVKTICMHGSPMSKFDNRDIWKKYDYREFGIIGEPYFDIDFNEVLYLTDTGRHWNNSRGNVRDLVQSKYRFNFKSTFDVIHALRKNELPSKIMLNVHTQRWDDKFLSWSKELVLQNIKNVVKKSFF